MLCAGRPRTREPQRGSSPGTPRQAPPRAARGGSRVESGDMQRFPRRLTRAPGDLEQQSGPGRRTDRVERVTGRRTASTQTRGDTQNIEEAGGHAELLRVCAEGGPARGRIGSILRQLKDAPSDLRVEVSFARTSATDRRPAYRRPRGSQVVDLGSRSKARAASLQPGRPIEGKEEGLAAASAKWPEQGPEELESEETSADAGRRRAWCARSRR